MNEEQDIPAWSKSPGEIIEIPRDPIPILSGKAEHILHTLHRDEPVFILRAKDILSTLSLLHYVTLVESYNPFNPVLESLNELINEFRQWQMENPAEVKLPD